MFHSSPFSVPVSVPAPCVINRGTIVNKQDMLRLLSSVKRVRYTYTIDHQVHSSGTATIAQVFAEPQQSTMLANQVLYLNLYSFDYLEIKPAIKPEIKPCDTHLEAPHWELETIEGETATRFDLVQGQNCLSLVPLLMPIARLDWLNADGSNPAPNPETSALADLLERSPDRLAHLSADLLVHLSPDLSIEDLHHLNQLRQISSTNQPSQPNPFNAIHSSLSQATIENVISNATPENTPKKIREIAPETAPESVNACVFSRLLAAKRDVETDNELWY